MRSIILFTILCFPVGSLAQSVSELYLAAPADAISVPAVQRAANSSSEGDLLRFRVNDTTSGEMKLISRSGSKMLVGISTYDCDASDLQFWAVKGGKWIKTTPAVIKPLGKKDIVAILSTSPATVSELGKEIGIPFYYTFEIATDHLKLIARKQTGCDVAGTVYNYSFDGKRYKIQK
ncbi:MAG TPA: hypothetical protein PLP07_13235 [Pyrinomonadaceae bacterium]|nr:hypothetical protein [Chloracidobacterium sp.]MBP9934760.1 hypothetical protein [Pyrinomonadaceae bacterium]MBK7803209.1 hypothetical protein [Chloracidobacterium sp.]MBK9438146.1 hypothetical protein [Chloracidobacterium sp.]MBK9767544.1 hypothetical protein [Chloracidobacterium sp.]